jgi:hypothetical protein
MIYLELTARHNQNKSMAENLRCISVHPFKPFRNELLYSKSEGYCN